MAKNNAVLGLENLKSIKKVGKICNECVNGKAIRTSHKRKDKTARAILDLIHTDICGPISPKGKNGEKYCQFLTDDYTGEMWASSMKLRSEAGKCTKNMVLNAQKMASKHVKAVRMDGAKELTLGDTKKFLDANWSLLEEVPPYSLESNGRDERLNRTVFEKGRTILSDLHMMCTLEYYKKLWSEAIQCIVHVYNSTLTRNTNREARGKTPYELVTGKNLDISNLRIFGSKVKVLAGLRKGKYG